MTIFPRFVRPWPKPRIKLVDLGSMWARTWWQCAGAPEILSGGLVVGYGATPAAAYDDFTRRAEKAQAERRGRYIL